VRLQQVSSPDQIALQADYATEVREDGVAEDAIRTLSQQPGVTSARWSILNEGAADWTR
jgi:putative Mg2+ transporter-C (MgtC) family protein